MEIIFHPCGGCGVVYGTTYTEGAHVCPGCGHVDTLIDWTEFLRPEVRDFAVAMERRLRAGEFKDGWKGEMPQYLSNRAQATVQDLDEALDLIRANGNTAELIQSLAEEAADLANFAMMLLDVVVNWEG